MNVNFFLGPHKSAASSIQRLIRENIQSRFIRYIDQYAIKKMINKYLSNNGIGDFIEITSKI